jgi:hypothetical protein
MDTSIAGFWTSVFEASSFSFWIENLGGAGSSFSSTRVLEFASDVPV